MNTIEIKNLTKAYPGFKLDNLNLTLPSGCIMGLHYHRTANNYKSGKYVAPITPFIVRY